VFTGCPQCAAPAQLSLTPTGEQVWINRGGSAHLVRTYELTCDICGAWSIVFHGGDGRFYSTGISGTHAELWHADDSDA